MRKRTRVLTLVASMALLGGTAWAAAGSTGAYFSQTVGGGITGTVGSIHIAASSPTAVTFSNLLPGASQSITVSYTNSGPESEDVYLTFPNLTALSALNNLGRYGSVTVSTSGYGTEFQSFNLNDNTTECPTFTNVPATGGSSGCWPLPSQILLDSNLPTGQSDSFTFTFEYASALTGEPATTAPWNSYPLPGGTYTACIGAGGTDSSCNNHQFTINSGDGAGTGLPFNLVATQHGITPGQTGSTF